MLKNEVELLPGSDAAGALEAAVRLGDGARVSAVLTRFPVRAKQLDHAVPNGAFGAFGAIPLIAANQRNRAMIEALFDWMKYGSKTSWFRNTGDFREVLDILTSSASPQRRKSELPDVRGVAKLL